MTTGKSALIVGGGIGGMATAITLRRVGWSVELIDIDPDWKVYGAGLTITGSTLRAFRDLGLLDAIGREGFFSKGRRYYRFDGTFIGDNDETPVEDDLPSSGGIMRPKLHQIMSGEVRSLGTVVRLGISVQRVEQDGQGVSVRFSDGSEGRYDLLVGADGIYSDIRATLFPDPAKPVYSGQMSWRVVAERKPDMERGEFYFGHERVGGITPCSQSEVYAWTLHPEPNPTRMPAEEQPAVLRGLLAHFGGPMADVREKIGPDSSILRRPFEHMIQPAPWNIGRVVLIGDAAHATTPHLASGAGMAVEDALVLADELQKSDGHVPVALDAFTERRFERCRFVVESSVEIGRRQLEGAPADELSERMAKAMERLAEPI